MAFDMGLLGHYRFSPILTSSRIQTKSQFSSLIPFQYLNLVIISSVYDLIYSIRISFPFDVRFSVPSLSDMELSGHYRFSPFRPWRPRGSKLNHSIRLWYQFSICVCHPYARAILIFFVSFQFYRMSPTSNNNWI